MELSISKNKINSSDIQGSTIFENLANNEKSIEKNNDFDNSKDDKDNQINNIKKNDNIIDNIDKIEINCYNNKNLNLFNKNEINNNHCSIKNLKKDIKNKNKKKGPVNINEFENNNLTRNIQNNEFENCKIDNNINININNNLNNINNLNTINNISSINNNSELNNNNYIDVSSNMTYFLSVEKSHRRPITSIIDKNILSLKKNNYENNNNISNRAINNEYRNSVGINKYKWKLLPKHKYNTQICKSYGDNQSISVNDENQKNSQLTTLGKENINNNIKTNTNVNTNFNTNNNSKLDIKNDVNNISNLDFNEFKKHKEEQDKKIKSLQDKIKSLYKIIKEEKNKEFKNDQKISKLEEFVSKGAKINSTKNEKKLKFYKNENIHIKRALNDIKFVESQKDYRIKKLEEQLENLKKNNKINKQLLIKKNNQIKTLIDSKSKQDEIIKKYEILKDINIKNNSTKGISKINFFDNNENTSNNLFGHSTSFSFSTKNKNSNTNNKLTLPKNNSHKKFSINKTINKNNNKEKTINIKKESKNKNKTLKTTILKKQINTNNISNFADILNLEQEILKKGNSCRDKNNRNEKRINTQSLNKNNSSDGNNKSLIDDRNINYNNYCNSLCNKSKNRYSNKVSLNRIKIYKYNKSQKVPTNITNQICNNKINSKKKDSKDTKNEKKDIKKNKIYSFKKSKKLSKDYESDLKEMYLKAGTVQKEQKEQNDNNEMDININMQTTNNNEIKINPSTSNNILYRNNNNYNKTNVTNSNNNTTITNNNITNLSMSPILLTRFHNIENLSMDEKLNLSGNINNNNLSNFNNILKSSSNDEIEKEKIETNRIYKKLWDEGFLRYEEMCKNKLNDKNEENDGTGKILEKNENFWKLNFGMANELLEININKEDFMLDVKNKFLNNFFEKKIYGDNEKKYITDNILFLNKEGIIDINKKVNENNINNNEIIIPVLKDVT